MIRVVCPLHVDLPRKKGKPKRVYLSRNVWDNLHFAIRQQVKNAVNALIHEQIEGQAHSLYTPVTVEMWLYPSRSTCDLGNFCDVISKIVQDSVVSYGCIADDTVKYIKHEIRHAEPCDGDPRLVLEYNGCTEVSEKSGNV